MRSRIADPELAPEGRRRIEWAARHSPVLARLFIERLGDGSLRGRKIAAVLHLEAKTANLILQLRAAGASLVVTGANPWSTQDSVAAALVAEGIEVHASHQASREQFEADLMAVADTQPELIIDDGAELTSRILEQRPGLMSNLLGVTEETTTGVVRLRAMEAAGRLSCPAIAANDAWSKHLYDNRYGTGQSAFTAIVGLTNLCLPGRNVCVIGYGWVGKGMAQYARALGMKVTVVEVDPIPALEAFMDGHRVARLADAVPTADLIVTATGGIKALAGQALALAKDGVLIANVGHHDLEIDQPALEFMAASSEVMRPGVTRYTLADGRSLFLLADGRLVNIAGSDGHPIEIMDLSFSVQALAVHHLASAGLPPGLHRLPADLDREIARIKLATRGIELDRLTDEQQAFYRQWAT